MGICGWIVLGGLAGWLASIFAGTDRRMGALANIIVGIIGSFVGGMIFNFAGGHGVTGFNLYSFGVAFVGAAVTLFIAKRLFKF